MPGGAIMQVPEKMATTLGKETLFNGASPSPPIRLRLMANSRRNGFHLPLYRKGAVWLSNREEQDQSLSARYGNLAQKTNFFRAQSSGDMRTNNSGWPMVMSGKWNVWECRRVVSSQQ